LPAEAAGYVSSVESNSPLMCGLSEQDRRRLIPLYTHLAPAQAPLSDEQIVRSLEAHGVEFQRFMGGIAGTKDCWTTAGSQDVRKLAAGVRALIAAWGVKLEGGE
jgi:hypothetical protein